MQSCKEVLAGGVIETDRIVVEVSIFLHVVDIGPTRLLEQGRINFEAASTSHMRLQPKNLPNRLQRDAKLLIVLHDLLDDAPIPITPAALVETEGEVLLHGRQTDGAFLVSHGDLGLRRPGKEVEVNAAADGPPGDVLGAQEDVLAVGVAQVDAVRIGDVVSLGAGVASDERQVAGVAVDFKVPRFEVEGVRAI